MTGKHEKEDNSDSGDVKSNFATSGSKDTKQDDTWMNKDVNKSLGTLGALFHVIKGSMGSGILSIPVSFKSGGLWTSLVGAILVGVVYAHCVYMMVYSCRTLCWRLKKPRLEYAEIAEAAFQTGPARLRAYTRLAKNVVDVGLFLSYYSICAVYVVFIASSVKQVVELNYDVDVNVRLYILLVTALVLPAGMIHNLGVLVPFSFMSICALVFCLGFVLYEVFQELPPLSSRPAFTSFQKLPYFFSSMMYNVDGIGTILPIENLMKNPQRFLGCFGVLNIAIAFLTTLYSIMGFFGYLRYGEATQASITLNISSSFIGNAVKLLVSLNVLCSYIMFFCVPCQILWRIFGQKVTTHRKTIFYFMRAVLVLGTVLLATSVPNLEAFVGLVGAICDATLILFFPPVIELVTFWEDPAHMGPGRWKLYKNLLIIAVWIVTLVSGSETSISKISALYK